MVKSEYKIIDNGGEKFIVKCFEDHTLSVYLNIDDSNPKLLFIINSYQKIFIGIDSSRFNLDGNSILVKLNETDYIYIGSEIKTMQFVDDVKSYYSRIGNSCVPYPYAVGENHTYLMLENKYITNDKLIYMDPYEQLYDSQYNSFFAEYTEKKIYK